MGELTSAEIAEVREGLASNAQAYPEGHDPNGFVCRMLDTLGARDAEIAALKQSVERLTRICNERDADVQAARAERTEMQVALCARIEELERELEQRLEYNQNQAAIILAEREWHDSQLSEVLAERDAFQSQNTQLRRELATALERAEDLQGAYDSIKAELYREQERVERADRKCQEWKRERDHALKEMGNEQEAFRRACVRVKSAERRGMEAAFRYSLSHLPPSIFETTVLAAVDFFIDQQEDTPDGE